MLPQRKHPRVLLQAKVTITGPESTVTADANEIGAGGMAIRYAGLLAISQPVELEFVLPGGPQVRLAAVVWWKKDGNIGLRFDVSSASRPVIERWVQERIEGAKYFTKPI